MERKRPLKFTTPASSNGSTGSGKGRAVKEGLRTEGRMPVDEGDHQQGALATRGAKATRASKSLLGKQIGDVLSLPRKLFGQL